MCGPGQRSSGNALFTLMVAACLFLLAGTVIPLRINHRDGAASGLWASPSPGDVCWFPGLCTHSTSIWKPTFLLFCPTAAVILALDLSLLTATGTGVLVYPWPADLQVWAWCTPSPGILVQSGPQMTQYKRENMARSEISGFGCITAAVHLWRWKASWFCHYSLVSFLGVFLHFSMFFFSSFTLVAVN